MIRDMRRNGAQPKDTMHKAAVDMVTGMGIVITSSTTVDLPTEETASNIYVATKERIPTGLNAARTDMSDYDDDFVKIAKDELIGLERYTDGEKFATDQYVAADFGDDAVAGFGVSVGTDGLWKKATVSSKYIFDGIHNDNGHRLVMVRVEADAVNA
jgi:hypothetical protein